MKPAITQRERISPAKAPVKRERTAFKWTVYIVVAFLIALAVYASGKPHDGTPVAHADTDIEDAPDAQQEAAYCRAWDRNQTHITNNASNMAIAQHCAKYL